MFRAGLCVCGQEGVERSAPRSLYYDNADAGAAVESQFGSYYTEPTSGGCTKLSEAALPNHPLNFALSVALFNLRARLV